MSKLLGSKPRPFFMEQISSLLVKYFTISWSGSLAIFLFFAWIAIAMLAPLSMDAAIPNLADYMNHLAAIIQAKTALLDGQFPLRVAPGEQMGWGYPFYQFYASTIYTITGFIYLLLTPDNPLLAYNFTLWGGLVLGGFYMYKLAFWLMRSMPAALLAGCAYLYAPYYIIVVNHLGGLTETVALGLLPAVLYYTLQRYTCPHKDVFLLAASLCWYLLITTHMPTFIYTSFFTAVLLLLVTSKNSKRWRNLLSVGICYLLACVLAIWFLAPIVLLQKYLFISYTYTNPDYVTLFRPYLSQLLFPAAALTSGFKTSALFTIHPAVGWPILIAAGLCCYAYFNKLTSGNKRADYWLPSLLVCFFIAFFLVWSPINIWQWIPQPFLVVQRSWRLLSQVIWLGALLLAWAVCWLFNNRLDLRHVAVGALLLVMSSTAWFPQSEHAAVSLKHFIKSPLLIYNNNSYLINFHAYPQFVATIDSLLIDPNATLKLNKPYTISYSLLNLALAPNILIEGKVNRDALKQHVQLAAMVNGWIIGAQELNTSSYKWNIPLNPAFFRTQNKADLKVEFVLRGANLPPSEKIKLPLEKMLLTGFLRSAEIRDVRQTSPYCQHTGIDTFCELNVPREVKLLELPQLYYPGLLSITVNGKLSNYQSVLYQGHLVTGVMPDAGQINKIRIRFSGLPWANNVSLAAWVVWLSLCGWLVFVRIFKRAA